jgi:hypothetical protein
MTAGTTIISGQNYGNGTYIASATGTPRVGEESWRAFDNSITTGWHSDTNNNLRYSTATGKYTGITTMTVGSIIYGGEWLQLQTPNNVLLDSFTIVGRQGANLWASRAPNEFYVFGSLDGRTWELIRSYTTSTFAPSGKTYIANSTKAYSYFRLLTSSLAINAESYVVNIAEWKLFGQEIVFTPSAYRLRH